MIQPQMPWFWCVIWNVVIQLFSSLYRCKFKNRIQFPLATLWWTCYIQSQLNLALNATLTQCWVPCISRSMPSCQPRQGKVRGRNLLYDKTGSFVYCFYKFESYHSTDHFIETNYNWIFLSISWKLFPHQQNTTKFMKLKAVWSIY